MTDPKCPNCGAARYPGSIRVVFDCTSEGVFDEDGQCRSLSYEGHDCLRRQVATLREQLEERDAKIAELRKWVSRADAETLRLDKIILKLEAAEAAKE